jgi:hypothetical protein
VVDRAAAAGMRVANLDTYRSRDDAAGPGLVLGYGNLADGQVDEAVALLAATVADLSRPGGSGARRWPEPPRRAAPTRGRAAPPPGDGGPGHEPGPRP